MQLLKVLFLLVVLVVVIEAQKGGTKRPKPTNVPQSPSGRKVPQPRPAPSPRPQPRVQQPQQPRIQPQQPQEPDDSGNAGNSVEEPESVAEPPAVVPQTSFSCNDKPYQPGMYADMEVDCSVYHMCFDNRKESFLCGTGTAFNQEILSCDHKQKVNCANSPQFYEANTELGKPGAEPSGDSGSKAAPARPQPSRPRVQQPSKQSPPRPAPAPAPAPKQPKPFADDETEDEPDEAPEERPAPVPQPKPQRPSKTNPQPKKPQPKTPIQPKKPIEQSYDDDESENTNVRRRAYRARY